MVLNRKIPFSAVRGRAHSQYLVREIVKLKVEVACLSGMSLLAKQITWYHILHHLNTHNSENLKSYQLLKAAAVYNTVNFVDIL